MRRFLSSRIEQEKESKEGNSDLQKLPPLETIHSNEDQKDPDEKEGTDTKDPERHGEDVVQREKKSFDGDSDSKDADLHKDSPAAETGENEPLEGDDIAADGEGLEAQDGAGEGNGEFYDPLNFEQVGGEGEEAAGDSLDSAPNGRGEHNEEPSEDSNAAPSDIFDEQGSGHQLTN